MDTEPASIVLCTD